jgi:hypothetical protein
LPDARLDAAKVEQNLEAEMEREPMIPVLTLVVLAVLVAVEVGWLCRC